MPSVKCDHCQQRLYRSAGRINEANKYHWKQFCSPRCLSKSRIKRIELFCSNPLCNKGIAKREGDIKKVKLSFCSHACSATYNNYIRQKSIKLKKCRRVDCYNFVHGSRKETVYCSDDCAHIDRLGKTSYSPEKIVETIRAFFDHQGRIPTKNDLMYLYRPARKFFTTWNQAVISAGFDPNPVRFAKHFIANDGHPCDSLSEKIVDDWLYARKIPHEVKIKYPWNNGMSADFKVDKWWIELFGLCGQLKTYDGLLKVKLQKIKEYKLSLISIYLSDLFPVNKLEHKLKILKSPHPTTFRICGDEARGI